MTTISTTSMANTSAASAEVTFKQQVIASSSGALITALIMTPMDVVKVRLQSQIKPISKGECFLFSNGLMDHLCTSCADTAAGEAQCQWFNRPGQFNGTIDAFVKITRVEGLRSLWSGLTPTIISAIPATVFYFTFYDNLLHQFRRRIGDHWTTPMYAGVLARTAAVTVVSPLELVRTKMQSEVISIAELGRSIRTTVQHNGYLALWRGLGATFVRDIPFSAVHWTLYEYLKARLTRAFNKTRTDFTISFASGATSGTVASIITHPFDIVKTHRQITLGQIDKRRHVADSSCAAAAKSPIKLPSMAASLKEIIRVGGVRSLYAGIVPRIVKVAPACATMIGTYEYLKIWFKRSNAAV